MQQIVLVLAILILMSLIPKQYREKTAEKAVSVMQLQKANEAEAVIPEEVEVSDNDFCIYCSVIDISGL